MYIGIFICTKFDYNIHSTKANYYTMPKCFVLDTFSNCAFRIINHLILNKIASHII